MTSTGDPTSENYRKIEDLLRVLLRVSQPFQERSASMPDIEPFIHEEFFTTLHKRLLQVESLMSNNEPRNSLGQESVLMLRLLQFGLGFRNVWWFNRRDISDDLPSLLFKCALVSNSSHPLPPFSHPTERYTVLQLTLILLYIQWLSTHSTTF